MQAIFCAATRVISGLCGRGDRAHHLAHLLSGDPACSIPRLPSPLTPPPGTLLSCPCARGEPTAFRSHLKITPPHHKANKRRAKAAGLPWLLSSLPRPGIGSASGPQASPAQGLAVGPLQPATQRPKARAPLIVPGRTRAGWRRATKYNSEHRRSAPGRSGRSGPRGLGVLGPESALALPPKEGPDQPRSHKAPRRGQGCVSKRSWFPGLLSEQNHPDPRAARPGLWRAPGHPRTRGKRPSSPGRQAGPLRTAAGGRAGPRRCGPAACDSEARAALTGRLQGVGPEPCRPLAPLRSALLPARPRLLASRPRVPRSRPPPGSAGTSELEPLAAAPGFPQCTARRSSHPFPASRVRPPLPALPGAPALTPSCAGALDVNDSSLGCTQAWRLALSPGIGPRAGAAGVRPQEDACPERNSACVFSEHLLCDLRLPKPSNVHKDGG